MSEQVILSAEATGGQGNVFENEAAAYFLSCMLAGKPVFGESGGIVTRVSFQQANKGWMLDDIVLGLREGAQERKWAFSVKSNRQVTRNGAPLDFVDRVWRQFLRGSPPFDRATDSLGIVVSGLPAEVSRTVKQVHELVRSMPAADLGDRLLQDPAWPPKRQRQLIESFRCPADLEAEAQHAGVLLGDVLARVDIVEMDFAGATPPSTADALTNCRDALRSKAMEEARALWESLLRISDRRRPREGSLVIESRDVSSLVGELRSRYALAGYPYHEADWRVLESSSRALADTVPATLGGLLSLPRQAETDLLAHEVSGNRFVAVVGESGTGKTVLVKGFLQRRDSGSVMIDAGDLDSGVWKNSVLLRLTYPLRDLFGAAIWADPVVFIDGLDRLHTPEGFRTLVSILTAAVEDSCLWRVVVTCQAASWQEAVDGMQQANFQASRWSLVPLGDLSDADLRWTAETFPTLRGAIAQPHLRSMLRRIKVLAIFANRASQGQGLPDTSTWVAEADLVEWYWQAFVNRGRSGLPRSSVLQKLAVAQADGLKHELPGRSFQANEQQLLADLTREGICTERDGRLSFSHDLLGDWSRQRALLAEGPDLRTFLAGRIPSPVWNNAVRLHGARVLDREGVAGWQKLCPGLAAPAAGTVPMVELLLDSLFMARNGKQVLHDAKVVLFAENGQFLRAFLSRFLHFGTLPTIAGSPGTVTAVEINALDAFRTPLRPYWLPVLEFLIENSDEIVSKAGIQAARIADSWLRNSVFGEQHRAGMARLALDVYRRILLPRAGEAVNVEEEAVGPVWRAVIASFEELPGEVEGILRAASGRDAEEIPDQESLPKWLNPQSWIGPRTPPDSVLQQLCLDTDALVPLMRAAPALAEEVILACLIDEPPRISWTGDSSFSDRGELCLERRSDWEPPFYTRGPFLRFLNENPDVGCRTIVRLLDFAMERWRPLRRRGEPTGLTVNFPDAPRTYHGDQNVMYWHSATCGGPNAAVSALMALEYWLLKEAEAGQGMDGRLGQLLTQTSSLAVVGVVLSFGKQHPHLVVSRFLPRRDVRHIRVVERSAGG
jgi:hypothetical protein